jgi:hypothetical protein
LSTPINVYVAQNADYNDRAYRLDGTKVFPQGVYGSFDQLIMENVGLFARVGHLIDDKATVGTAGDDWQFGFNLGGGLWGRSDDSFFAGIGQAWYAPGTGRSYWQGQVSNWMDDTVENIRPETHFEANYKIGISNGIKIVVYGQYVTDIVEWTAVDNYIDKPTPTDDDPNATTQVIDPRATSFKYHYSDGYAAGVRLALTF